VGPDWFLGVNVKQPQVKATRGKACCRTQRRKPRDARKGGCGGGGRGTTSGASKVTKRCRGVGLRAGGGGGGGGAGSSGLLKKIRSDGKRNLGLKGRQLDQHREGIVCGATVG